MRVIAEHGLGAFQLGRLKYAIDQRQEAGNSFSSALVDRAIVSLYLACGDAGVVKAAQELLSTLSTGER